MYIRLLKGCLLIIHILINFGMKALSIRFESVEDMILSRMNVLGHVHLRLDRFAWQKYPMLGHASDR